MLDDVEQQDTIEGARVQRQWPVQIVLDEFLKRHVIRHGELVNAGRMAALTMQGVGHIA